MLTQLKKFQLLHLKIETHRPQRQRAPKANGVQDQRMGVCSLNEENIIYLSPGVGMRPKEMIVQDLPVCTPWVVTWLHCSELPATCSRLPKVQPKWSLFLCPLDWLLSSHLELPCYL